MAVKIGIIGAGGIANKFCEAVKLVSAECGVSVTAVASKSYDRAADFAERNDISEKFGSYEEMLSKADINAVYIATTHNFHMENIMLCLKNGKHVICEKPMVLSSADAKKAFEYAAEKKLVLMEAMWSRFLPHIVRAKSWITSGKIGEIQGMTGQIGFKASDDINGRILNPALAGGAIYDIGVYPIEIMSYLAGEKITDSVGVYRPHPVTGVDKASSVILRFETFDAVLQSIVSCSVSEFIYIYGTGGMITIPHASTGNSAELITYSGEKESYSCRYENGFTFEVKEFVKLITSGQLESETIPPRATMEAVKVYENTLKK